MVQIVMIGEITPVYYIGCLSGLKKLISLNADHEHDESFKLLVETRTLRLSNISTKNLNRGDISLECDLKSRFSQMVRPRLFIITTRDRP